MSTLSNLINGLTGKTAAAASNQAAADTFQKQNAATVGLNSYADTLPGKYSDAASGFAPYAEAGGSALSRLLSGLGLSGGDGSDFTASYRALPGYKAGLDTGTNAAIHGANSGNTLQSGATLKALQRYGSDYEDQKSGDYLSRLMGLTGVGASVTGAKAGIDTAGLGAETGVRQSAFGGAMAAAPTIGQGQVAGAQAQQTGLSNLLSSAAYLGGSFLGGRPAAPARNSSISPFGSGIFGIG